MGEVIGVVSLWLAKIDSEESLDNFTEITYTEDGSYKDSVFGEFFKTGYYYEGFKESKFLDKYSDDLSVLLENFSYNEIIFPRFVELITELQDSFNSVIMLYNYLYDSSTLQVYEKNDMYCKFFCYVSYKE